MSLVCVVNSSDPFELPAGPPQLEQVLLCLIMKILFGLTLRNRINCLCSAKVVEARREDKYFTSITSSSPASYCFPASSRHKRNRCSGSYPRPIQSWSMKEHFSTAATKQHLTELSLVWKVCTPKWRPGKLASKRTMSYKITPS